MARPSFKKLRLHQQLEFGNGIGPAWFPAWLRLFLTKHVSWFFEDASWRHHDFGYFIGFREAHRSEYDWKFFKAMWQDALTQRSHCRLFAVPVACLLSLIFYASVRAFGWRSFHYSNRYRRFKATLKADFKPSKSRVKGTSNPKRRRA